MKLRNLFALISTALITLSNNTFANQEMKMNQYNRVTESTMIKMQAKDSKNLETLLVQGAAIVKQTEPKTISWFALKEGNEKFYIFDVFKNEAGRTAHFNGQVAHILKESAQELVKGGWQQGVINNIHNAKVLSAKLPTKGKKMTVASYITFAAKPGCEVDVVQLLQGAAELVDKTEPNTTAWFAIRLSSSKFAIFDAFENEQGQKEHFAGKVAAALQDKASTHIVGGWDNGIVANIKSLKVLA